MRDYRSSDGHALVKNFREQDKSYPIRLGQKNSWQKLLISFRLANQCYLRCTFGIVVLWRFDTRTNWIQLHQVWVERP